MPTYDYRCKACHHAFEQFQSMKDATLKTCPSCGKKQLERLIGTGGAIIFKGSGFYITDYRSESYKKGEKSAAPAPESTSAKADSAASTDASAKPTTDSAPASKPAAPEPVAKSAPKSEPAAAASKSAKKRSSGSKR